LLLNIILSWFFFIGSLVCMVNITRPIPKVHQLIFSFNLLLKIAV
jgi:hypothetical protein